MKFRAVMIDSISMREFHSLITTLSKISKECVLRLTNESLYLIVCDEGNNVSTAISPKVWCHINQKSFFSEYNMEGVDKQFKDIFLGISSGNFAKSVSTLKQNAKSIKMKLTNKQYPCLSLEIEIPSVNLLHTRQVIHDVPVTVIPRKHWKHYVEPVLDAYNICIEMPSLKQLRSMVDRMKSMSSELIIKSSASGHLILQIKTEMAVVSSRWQNLKVLNYNALGIEEGPEEDVDHTDGEYTVCQVDIKKFSMFLSAEHITHSVVVCSIRHKKVVNLLIEHQGILSFQCYIPALAY